MTKSDTSTKKVFKYCYWTRNMDSLFRTSKKNWKQNMATEHDIYACSCQNFRTISTVFFIPYSSHITAQSYKAGCQVLQVDIAELFYGKPQDMLS